MGRPFVYSTRELLIEKFVDDLFNILTNIVYIKLCDKNK